MALKVTIDHPGFPKGEPLDVGGLLLENGKAVEVSEELANEFKARNEATINQYFEKNDMVTVEGSTPKKEDK